MILENIPDVRQELIESFYAEHTRQYNTKTRERPEDHVFIDYMMHDNPALGQNFSYYLDLLYSLPEECIDKAYRIMVGCLISTLKLIDNELSIRKLEE